MREILFRGKRVDNGEWVKGSFWDEIPGELGGIAQYGSCAFRHVDLTTVGQFTGLYDKNGTKIFEGDIIRSDNGKQKAVSVVRYGNYKPKMIYETIRICVGYKPLEYAHGLYCETEEEQMVLFDSPNLIEVIGNIHDNPELLKGGGGYIGLLQGVRGLFPARRKSLF